MNELLNDIENQNQFPTHMGGETYTPPTDELVIENLKKWQSDKFGILVHFGLYSQLGICESWGLCPEDEEWIPREGFEDYNDYVKYYTNAIHDFNPSKLDSKKWANAIKNAGAKYVIFSTKHHDGFCLFDSKYSDFKTTSPDCPYHMNPKADIVKEVFQSFRSEGLKVGAYLSKPDWHSDFFWWKYFPPKDRNPNYDVTKHPERWEKFIKFTHNQLDELTKNYGKVDILWLDGCWVRPMSTMNDKVAEFCKYPFDLDIKMEKAAEIVRKNQPGMIIVDRWVQGAYENYLTPERKTPDEALLIPWESCITMGNAWGYVPNDKFKSSRELIQLLIRIIAKGGNLLLGIGPDGNGEFAPEIYDRLDKLGKWLEINKDAVYGTHPVKPYELNKICYTKKDEKIFAFYLPDKEETLLPDEISFTGEFGKCIEITVLGVNEIVSHVIKNGRIYVTVSDSIKKRFENCDAVCFEIKI